MAAQAQGEPTAEQAQVDLETHELTYAFCGHGVHHALVAVVPFTHIACFCDFAASSDY